jgi:hypothetical protein
MNMDPVIRSLCKAGATFLTKNCCAHVAEHSQCTNVSQAQYLTVFKLRGQITSCCNAAVLHVRKQSMACL